MTHYRSREDAIWHNGRCFVPTVWGKGQADTRWVSNWPEFKAAGGIQHFNEDQTEIVMTLPAGYKFGIRFNDGS